MQDWPVEVADGSRIEEFLDHYDLLSGKIVIHHCSFRLVSG
jgi:hypothetical protein